MASTETYSNTSLINIASDSYTVNAGTVTRSGGKLTFSANSRCTFSKGYGATGLNTTKLKVNYNVDASGLVTRYNNNISIQLQIQYLEREYENNEYVYRDGQWQTIELIPYTSDEEKGNYKEDIIDTEGSYIKQMKVVIKFNGTSGTIDLTKLNIFNTVDIDPEELKEEITDEILDNPDIYDYINDLIDSRINENLPEYYETMVESVGTYIEPRTSDPAAADLYAGRIWLREDLVT